MRTAARACGASADAWRRQGRVVLPAGVGEDEVARLQVRRFRLHHFGDRAAGHHLRRPRARRGRSRPASRRGWRRRARCSGCAAAPRRPSARAGRSTSRKCSGPSLPAGSRSSTIWRLTVSLMMFSPLGVVVSWASPMDASRSSRSTVRIVRHVRRKIPNPQRVRLSRWRHIRSRGTVLPPRKFFVVARRVIFRREPHRLLDRRGDVDGCVGLACGAAATSPVLPPPCNGAPCR